jgi:hypothetical protein
VEGDSLVIRPTHRCPPAVLAALLAVAGDVKALIEAEGAAALAGFSDAPDVAADRAAIAADRWTADRPAPAPTETPAALVERLAEALARTRGHRITHPAKAHQYLLAEARRRLALTNDPLVRGLLLGAERHRAGCDAAAQK